MQPTNIRRAILTSAAATLVGMMAITGCHNRASHPDEKDAVVNSLKQNQLGDVDVSQDRDKGVMTLSGNVNTDQQKSQAGEVAKAAAPDYTVANEIGVRPPQVSNAGAIASDLDKAIEDNFKAAVKAHPALDKDGVKGSSKNGTLKVEGTVRTVLEKQEAERLAKSVPNVQQVVNEIKVKNK